MKVTLTKHGGIAAGIRRPPLTVDAKSLDQAAAQKLESLVAAAKSAQSTDATSNQARDAMSYTVAVEQDGVQTLLRASDASGSPQVRALIDWIERQA